MEAAAGYFSLYGVNLWMKIITKKEAVILELACDHEHSEQPSKPVGDKLLCKSGFLSVSPI